MNARLWIRSLCCAAALFAASSGRADLVVAENLLVNLNTDNVGVANPTWDNTGSLGGVFTATNLAGMKLNTFGLNDVLGVEFDGVSGGDAYSGPNAPAGITGNGTRSIEVWAYNQGIVAEETLVAWGRRGGPDGTNLSFNYGNNPSFGAVGHWGGASDLGWGSTPSPAAGEWHHLVYTYDGQDTRVYQDGQFRNGQQFPLNTHPDFSINIGTQRSNVAPFNLEPNLRLSGAIAAVRIHDGVLSAADVLNNYNEERSIYFAPEVPAGAAMLAGPKHRYSFSGNADDSVSGAHGTLSNPQGLATYHDGGLDMSVANHGAGGGVPSTNAATQGAYVDLPNGIISALGDQATFETWINVDNVRTWDRVFDFGRSNAGEDSSGGGDASEYLFMTTQSGAAGNALRFAHRSENEPPPGFNENNVDGFFRLTNGVEHHVAVVWDEVSDTQSLYLDGQLVRSGAIRQTITLAAMQDVNNWLGRSQWPDAMFDGTFNEFRIYDYALTADEVLGNFQSGPDVVNVIPEPSSIVLAAMGLIVAARVVRRNRAVR